MGIRADRESGREAGVSLVETALLLLLIAALAFTAVTFLGSSVRSMFDKAPPAFQPTVSLTSTTVTGGSSGGGSGGHGGGQGGGAGLECSVHVSHGGGTTSTTEVCVPEH